jgi:MYXO-CTERM domain-containing protein
LAALGANDLVDWSLSGSDNTNSFITLSTKGVSVTTSEPNSSFANFVQSPPGGWFGNFPAGTHIIYDQSPTGPVTFTFATAIQGFALTIDDAGGGNYTGTIEAMNGTTSLGAFSTGPSPYGLMFLGVLDPTADITSVVVGTAGFTNNSFAFGNLSLLDGATSSTPEPASVGFVSMGLAGLAMLARKRRATAAHFAKGIAACSK